MRSLWSALASSGFVSNMRFSRVRVVSFFPSTWRGDSRTGADSPRGRPDTSNDDSRAEILTRKTLRHTTTCSGLQEFWPTQKTNKEEVYVARHSGGVKAKRATCISWAHHLKVRLDSKIYYSATSCPINFHCECITVNEFCARFTIKEQVRSIYQPLRCIEHRTFLQVKSITVAEMSGLEKGTQYFMAWAAGLWVSMAFRSMTDSLIISAVSRLSLIDRHRRLSWKFIFIFSNCKQKY